MHRSGALARPAGRAGVVAGSCLLGGGFASRFPRRSPARSHGCGFGGDAPALRSSFTAKGAECGACTAGPTVGDARQSGQGESHGSTPPTPPRIRVRTRRFGGVERLYRTGLAAGHSGSARAMRASVPSCPALRDSPFASGSKPSFDWMFRRSAHVSGPACRGSVRRSGLHRRADDHALCRVPRRDDGPCGHARSGDFRTRRGPPEARPAAFTAQPPDRPHFALDSRGFGDCPPAALPRAPACMRRASRVIGSRRAYGVLLRCAQRGETPLSGVCVTLIRVPPLRAPTSPGGARAVGVRRQHRRRRPTSGGAFGPCRRPHRRRYTRPAGQGFRHPSNREAR